MLCSESPWSSKVRMDSESFRSNADRDLDQQFSELEELLDDLDLGRTARITTLKLDGEAKLEKEKHERELARIQKEKEIEEQRVKHEQEQQRRLAEIKAAQAKAEDERHKRIAAAQKLAEEEKALARQKAQQEKQEAEERQLKKAQEEAAKKKADADAKAKAKAQEEAAKAKEAAEAESKAKAKAQADAETAQRGGTNWPQVTAEYDSYMGQIQWIKSNVKAAMAAQPKEIKNQTMEIKLQLRPKFGMLTNSKSQLIQCRDGIKQIISSTQGNPLIYHWLLNLYSKMLIEQSESEANVKHQNALPLAMLTVLLWGDFPEIGNFVIPRFIKRCPQLIGYYCSIDTNEGRKKMGWRRDEDSGKYESQEQYMGRLSGICAVWSCMTQTKLSAKVLKDKHPYPLSHSWTFLARQLNKPPSDVMVTDYALVAAWWDMTAMRFQEAFGKQGTKLLDAIWDVWTGNKMDPPAMRLRGLGENWKSTGKIEAAWKPLQP